VTQCNTEQRSIIWIEAEPEAQGSKQG
jgi:hypothetical protein